jgi:ABC-type transport system involved in multi-copper enzyme maturation permease subunit
MNGSSIVRVILSGVIGIAIGVILTAVVNLASPSDSVVRMLVVSCLAGLAAGLAGYLLGARKKKQS